VSLIQSSLFLFFPKFFVLSSFSRPCDAHAKKTKKKIRNSPTVMIFKDGEKKDVVIGAVPKSTLVQTLEKYID